MNESLDTELTDDEFAQMVKLLRRYSATDMDQFDHWKFENSRSTVYIDIALQPTRQGTEGVYTDLSHLLK